MELITYYINSDGNIVKESKGLTASLDDYAWLKRDSAHRVVYPGFEPNMWREVKPFAADSVIIVDITLKDLPKVIQQKLPKELQMQLLIGAI